MWLPSPPPGTGVCGGFDGSESDDWTVIKLETRDKHVFTPRWGPDRKPAVWQPKKCPDGIVPRTEVFAAWTEIVETYELRRAYCDPGFHDETSWETEIEEWAAKWGEEKFVAFPTTSRQRMFPAVRRFEADLPTLTHDGCPFTVAHMRNARKVFDRSGQTYTLGKPAHHQKIDCAVTSVIAHEAASDERADGWEDQVDTTVNVFRQSQRRRVDPAQFVVPPRRFGKR